jgi:predicted DNA-binding WGR domain protein
MQKLYRVADGVLSYHEAWLNGGSVIEHWGRVGDRGQMREHRRAPRESERKALTRILAPAAAAGYAPIAPDAHAVMVVEYPVDGFGTPKDLEMRLAVEGLLNEALGWTGLGHCDGGSIGSGTMEVACLVVSPTIAEQVISAALQSSPFAAYTRIYLEDSSPLSNRGDR